MSTRKFRMETFVLRAVLQTPIIQRGFCTLDALLMATLRRGDVQDLLLCEDDLYFASAGMPTSAPIPMRAAFVASMRPEHSPHWLEVINSNTKTSDLKIGLSRQREAGNVVNGYQAHATDAIEWYATGHAQAVWNVVKDIPFIGKRRASGYGEVVRWEVENGELNGIVGYAGEPLRPVPAERWKESGDWIPEEAAWKAPYWDVKNRTKCFVPGRLQ
jgi:hypothetical protein